MDEDRRRLAKTGAGSIISAFVVTPLLAWADMDLLVAAAFGWLAATLFMLWGYRPKLSVWILALALAGSIIVLAVHSNGWAARPSIDDVEMSFIPDRIVGPSLSGRIIVRNKSEARLMITGYRISVGSDYVDMQAQAERPIPKKGSTSFQVDSFNHLARGGRISFEAHYAFNKRPAKKAAFAMFLVPIGGGNMSIPIEGSECCEREKSDFSVLAKQDGNVADHLEGSFDSTVPEKKPNGMPLRMIEPHSRRVFIFDGRERIVRFKSVQRDGWHELQLPLRETFDRMHDVRFRWHEPNGYMALVVDGYATEFDVDVGKSRTWKIG